MLPMPRSCRLALCLLLPGLVATALGAECASPAMSPEAVVQQAATLLERTGAFEGMRLELELIGEVPGFAQHLTLLDGGMRSRVPVQLSGAACGRAQVATAWIRLKAFQEVWVYGQAAKAGQPASLAQPHRAEVDLAGARLVPGDVAAELDGLWLVQDVRSGSPALARHLQPEPLVKRDEMVRVVVMAPGLQISTRGRAMRQGALGESVPVLVERADSSLLAVVAGKGEVHVQE